MAKCNKCGAEIVWIKTARSGKNVPLNDNLGHHKGPIFDEEGNFHKGGGYGRTPHWETCPAAEKRGSEQRNATPTEVQKQRQWELVCQAGANTWSYDELRKMAQELSRLVGVMRSSGADPSSVEKTRAIVQGIIRRGWSQ